MNQEVLKDIQEKCADIEKSGHGIVLIRIKNGAIYLIEATISKLYDKPIDNCPKKK